MKIHRLSILSSLILAALLSAACSKDNSPSPTRVVPEGKAGWTCTPVADGVNYWEFKGKDPASGVAQFIHVSEIDLNKGYRLGFFCDLEGDKKGILCSDIMKEKGAVVATNGGFGASKIFIKVDGTVYKKIDNEISDKGVLNWRNDAAICTSASGSVFIANAIFSQKADGQSEYGKQLARQRNYFLNDLKDTPNIISGAPLLIDAYNPLGLTYVPEGESWVQHKDDTEHPFYHQSYRHPRTAIGITGDNRLIMMVVDGRLTNCSGVNAKEMTRFLIDNFNPKYAMNLDGGKNSVMCVAGLGDPRTHVVSWPCGNEKCDHSGEHAVQTFLYVTKKPF